ncbi:MAG: translation elongation factor G [Candidatus Wildermuthbacteria bacterium GWA2_46_15]|uniref:Elongation factor G n=1 Tax=Candidatus Wildermuthbacteria bacterium GWA2_46_15 TaxID=1802443 RepID=A0A1G2QPD1_9BACT|nr:MAG: translation elongation factor G [Candidatus Wildermuthbacteria bacterium GWA2_46_15]
MPRLYPLERVRNIGIIAHIDAGKTTTTETLLYYTGKTHKIGNIDRGDTQMDWMAQERERGITITAAATTCFWKAKTMDFGPLGEDEFRINIIDTPGHIDFTAEVQRSLRVLDGAVVIFDGKEGVQPQSETVWRQADKYQVARMCYINKLNLTGGDFYESVDSIQKRLAPNASPIQLPIGEEGTLKGVVDLITRKAYVYADDEGLSLKEVEVPRDMKELVEKYRGQLIERTVEADNELMEKFLSDNVLTDEELLIGIRKSTLSGQFFPILAGDGRKAATETILDAVIQFLPSPLDLPPIKGIDPRTGQETERKTSDEEPFASLAFKVAADPYVGTLTFFRVYSGKLTRGSYVLNTTTGEKERIGRILRMHANEREEVEEIYAGEIGATIGLKNTGTGHTLCDENNPIVLETIIFPEPVISVRIEPKTKADQEKMSLALRRLTEEDPTFKMRGDIETGETIISGMGELHLEIIVDRMKREFSVEANVGRPQVAYKETIKGEADVEGKYVKQSGGRGQYGHVWLKLKPKERGAGFEFINEIRGGTIPQEFIPAVEKGVKEAMEKGVVAGYPIVDTEVTLYDGSFHEVDSSELAFKIAAIQAIRDGAKRAKAVLLEPIMKIEIVCPQKSFSEVIGNFNGRRGQIKETSDRLDSKIIDGTVPLSEMFGYATALRSLTEGRGTFTMEFSHYQEVPNNIAQEIIEGKRK